MTIKRFNIWSWVAASSVAIIAMIVYALTAEPTASYWDCPEYISTAALLEVGHPPGNPVWMLTAHIFSYFAATPAQIAYAVNIMSGVCSALACMYLCLTICLMLRRMFKRDTMISRRRAIAVIAGGVGASLAFAFTDTLWFSAVEAEVYAFSVFLTALMVWLACLAGEHYGRPRSLRYVILLAYLSGLSIGVHQLNLLCLPVLALIMMFYGYDNLPVRKIVVAVVGSVLIIAGLLFGMMPWTLLVGGWADLLTVNHWGWPLWSGVIIYVLLTLVLLIIGALLVTYNHTRVVLNSGVEAGAVSRLRLITTYIIVGLGIFASGFVCFGANLWIGLVCTVAATYWIYLRRAKHPLKITTALWGLLMLLVGYSSYAIIPLRGYANTPLNTGMPADIFSFESYVQRDQYGKTALLYGPTPYSTPLLRETVKRDSTGQEQYDYSSYYMEPKRVKYALVNGKYQVLNHREEYRYAPETMMWLPRIHSNNPSDIEAYGGWAGMDSTTMEWVEAPVAIDSAGNLVGRRDADGKRHKAKVPRPTYWQNTKMLMGYQVSYMYLRYLMWNFVGRQNDVYGNGESDAGNFMTGIGPIDQVMLKDPDGGIPEHSRDNPGRRVFYFIPLLIGILGMVRQLSGGRRGRRMFLETALLFVLTGVAIVVYLNQTPGQPRERDYSFVGSFYAYSIWIGVGLCYFVRKAGDWEKNHWPRQRWLTWSVGAVAALGLPVWMFAENLPDHNRANRTLTRDVAHNIFASIDRDAIYFINGDNYTFPVWYLQEVEGERGDIRSINLAYLSTPWYIEQLRIPTREGKAVAMTMPRELCNPLLPKRFAWVALAETDTLDAVEALRQLYATPEKAGKPTIPARWLRLKGLRPGEEIIMDTRDVSAGSSRLGLDRLMMLDIIATNADQGWKRPIYWSHVLTGDRLIGLRDNVSRRGLVLQLTPGERDGLFDKSYRDMTEHWLWGGMDKGIYVDQPGVYQVRALRLAMVQTADSLLVRGDRQKALQLAQLSEQKLPRGIVEYGVYVLGGKVGYEAVDLARIYAVSGDTASARRLLDLEQDLIRRNREYLGNLPPTYRKYTTSQILNRELRSDSILRLTPDSLRY